MIICLYTFIVVLSFILIITIYNLIFAPMLKNAPPCHSHPLVSILIPARNEEVNIAASLSSLIKQTYKNIEILVLDDFSSDSTSKVVQQFQQKDSRIILLKGIALETGWTGKNWACYQLGNKAKGDYFIFTDADNYCAIDAVEKTIGWMQNYNLTLFSTFPQQITKSYAEKLVVPVFDTFVYSFLPLWFTFFLKFPSMAAANGQWLAFSRLGYLKIGGHEAVKNHIVEDTELARLAKRKGEKILTTSGQGAVFGRMYTSWKTVVKGFSKNAFGLMGYKTIPFFLLIALLFSIYVVPYFFLLWSEYQKLAAFAILLGMVIRLAMALKYKQPVFVSTLLNPISIAATIIIALNSFLHYLKGSITWKERQVKFFL